MSFDDFFNNKNNKKATSPSFRKLENVSTKKISSKVNKLLNENAFEVGDNYKVKVSFDVPKSLVKEYIEKVKQDSGKDPLDNYSESEIAEEIINFIVKENMNIDSLSSSFTVGDSNDSSEELEVSNDDASNLEEESTTDEENNSTEDNDDGLINMTDSDIEFESDEVELGEEIEVDQNDITDKEKEKEEEEKDESTEEEETLEQMFKKMRINNGL